MLDKDINKWKMDMNRLESEINGWIAEMNKKRNVSYKFERKNVA